MTLLFPSRSFISPSFAQTNRFSNSKQSIFIPLQTRFSLNFLPRNTTFITGLTSCYCHVREQQPKYVYPDPIPEFALAETQKFREELHRRLSKNPEAFGNEIDAVVGVCTEIVSNFLHKEYGGPGTLLVEPFTDMLLVLKEKNLPGAAVAARAALLWAQNYVDTDWEIWTSQQSK